MARTTPVHSGYTIINGSGTGSNGGRIDVWVEYALGTQSVTGNDTPITAYFYSALNPGYSSSTKNVRGLNTSFSVNGTAGTAVTNGAYDFTSPDAVNLLGFFSGRIPHNSDGTKTIAIAGSFTTLSGYISGGSLSATVTLPTIPRASAITATDAPVTGVSTVTVSQYAGGFTHSIRWQFGSLSGYLTADGGMADTEQIISATRLEMPIPECFYDQIPDAPEDSCHLTCRTYSGSSRIGESTCAFTVRADKTLCAPTVTGTVEDCNPDTLALTGDKHTLVSGWSTALCTITAQGKNGASIRETRIGGVPVTGGSRTIDNMETGTVVFTATDSRGYPGEVPVTLPLIPYVHLTCDASVKRTDPTSGNGVLTLSGQCFRGSFGAAENVLTVTCEVGSQTVTVTPALGIDNSYYTTVTLSGLDYAQSHRLTVTAEDALDTVTRTLTVPKGQPVFDWGEQDFRFHVPVTGAFLGSFRGDFHGTLQGVTIRTAYVSNSTQLQLQTKYPQFQDSTTGRQSIFLFGSDNGAAVHGLITVWGNGNDPGWSGTDGVSVSLGDDGQITVHLPFPAWDPFTLLSAEPFTIL